MLLRDLHYRNTHLNISGLNADDAVIQQDVLLRKFRKSVPGDVDILIVPTGHAERSTAIRVKAVQDQDRFRRRGLYGPDQADV